MSNYPESITKLKKAKSEPKIKRTSFATKSKLMMPYTLITFGMSVFVVAAFNPDLFEFELTSITASSLISGGIGLSQAEKEEK